MDHYLWKGCEIIKGNERHAFSLIWDFASSSSLMHSKFMNTNCKNKANDNLGKGVISPVRFPFSVCGYCLQCVWENVGRFSHNLSISDVLDARPFSLPVEDSQWPTVNTFLYDFYFYYNRHDCSYYFLILFVLQSRLSTTVLYNTYITSEVFVYTFQGRMSKYEAVKWTQVIGHVRRKAHPSALYYKKKKIQTIRKTLLTRVFQTQVCTMLYMYISHNDLGLPAAASFTYDPTKTKCVYFVNKLLTTLVFKVFHVGTFSYKQYYNPNFIPHPIPIITQCA